MLVDSRTAVSFALASNDATLAGRAVRIRICGGKGDCAAYRAHLAELDSGWFAARLPAGSVSVFVERDER